MGLASVFANSGMSACAAAVFLLQYKPLKQSNSVEGKWLLARASNTLTEVLPLTLPISSSVLCICFLQINQTHLLEHLVHQTSGVPPSLFHGMAPLTMVEVQCSPTPWRSGTQWITNGQTSLPAAARRSTCRTCRLTGSTNSACELLMCMASASPVKNPCWSKLERNKKVSF